MQVIFGRLSGFDQSLFDLAEVFGQVSLQFGVLIPYSVGSAEGMFGGEDCNVAMIVIAGTHNGIVEGVEFFEDAMLVGQDGNP